MEYCLRLRGVSGTENGLRIQKAVGRSVRTAMPAGDDGVTPVIAVVLMIGLIAVAGAVIGLVMFAALDDASGTLPDVRFQASADGVSLYHAGGDVLPLKSLVFYDGEMNPVPSVQLIKGGSTDAVSPAEGDVWETGDKMRFDEGVLTSLSIIGQDSRGNPALLWRGVNAMVLPIGDMVPDEWITGGNSDMPDSKPKYTLNNLQSWKELVESAKTENCNGAGKPLTESAIYYDEKDGMLYYYYQSYRSYLDSPIADTGISLQDFFQTKTEASKDMVKINLSQKVLTYENDTHPFQWNQNVLHWNTEENGDLVAKKESLCENKGLLYIAIQNPWDSGTDLLNKDLWRHIGRFSS